MEKGTKLTVRLLMNIIGAVGVIILLLLAAISFGWFSGLFPVNWHRTSFAAPNGVFELAAADSSGKYDALLTAPSGSALSGVVFEDGTPAALTATSQDTPEIRWLMNSESSFGNLEGEGIQPGSSGKLTFYVVAKQDGDLALTFSLDTVLYDSLAEPISVSNADNSEHIIPDTEPAARLSRGHILFFEHYDEVSGVYSDRITDSFQFTKTGAAAGTAYEISLYWVWPVFVDQLILPSDDALLRARGYKRLLDNGQSVVNAVYSSAFFAETIDGLSEMLSNMLRGSDNSGFNEEYYDLLNRKWNEADQIVGTRVGYIELHLTADLRDNQEP